MYADVVELKVLTNASSASGDDVMCGIPHAHAALCLRHLVLQPLQEDLWISRLLQSICALLQNRKDISMFRLIGFMGCTSNNRNDIHQRIPIGSTRYVTRRQQL